MNLAVVSYSNTGNNARFAACVAVALNATQIRVQAKAPFSNGSVFKDFLLCRNPEIDIAPERLSEFDCILFFAPVWLGRVAFPLRRCLRYFRKHPVPYGFLSISGGSLGDNPRLRNELKRRTHSAPLLVLDQHITSLLPSDPPPTSAEIAAYLLSEGDCETLVNRAIVELRRAIPEAF